MIALPSQDPNPSAANAWQGHVRVAFWVLVFGIAYVALFRFAVSLPVRAGIAACVWPADGLALGVLLRVRYPQWPAYCAMILVANAVGGYLSGFSFRFDGFIGMNVVQPALAAWIMRRYLNLPARLDTVRGMVSFTVVATLVTALASFFGAFDDQLSAGEPFDVLFSALFIADLLGIICVGPLMLAFSREGRRRLRHTLSGRAGEAALLFVALVAASHEVFGMAPDANGWVPQVQYFTIPFLVWAALRFGLRGASLALFTYATIAIWHTTNGLGPFTVGQAGPRETILALQLYIGMVGIMVLVGAALMTEFRDALADNESWRRRFSAAIEASGNVVFEIDTNDGRIDWGGDTKRIMGLRAEEISTTTAWTERIHPEDRDSLLEARRRLADGSMPAADLEYRVRRGDGTWMIASVRTYSVEAPASPLSLGRAQGRRIVGFVEDITAKRRAAIERAHLEAELRQAQKMEAIGTLAGGVAHDFNNILTSIMGYGELARDRAAPDSKQAHHLGALLKAAERGRQLTSQILTFSRKDPAAQAPVDLAALVDEVALLVRGSTRVAVEVAPHEEMPIVHGNATALHQLVMNLATNGIHAMEGAAREVLMLAVRVEHVDAARTLIQGPIPPGDYATVTVRDTGRGIDPETQRRMFEPFFTTKEAGRGTGLGLSLALSIARNHGGGIAVESTPGEGSAFTAYLPMAGASAPATTTAAGEAPRGAGERILIVDDEATLRELAEEVLAGLGYEVAGYATSAEARDALLAAPEKFDAVLSDEVMPGMTGTQLAAEVRAAGLVHPFVIITGYGGAGFEARAQQAGVDLILRKPYDRRVLADAYAALFALRRASDTPVRNSTGAPAAADVAGK